MSEIELDLGFPGLPVPDIRARLPMRGLVALTGASGAGKTTTLRAIAGLERAARGTVRVAGEDWSDWPPWRRPVGLVFQEARLFRHLDVAGNVGFGARRRGVPPARVAEVSSLLGLDDLTGRRVTTLSGGEARRVSLARALASGPRLLLLDEPLTGLDDARREELLGLLRGALSRAGIPGLLVSHDQREVAALADAVFALGPAGLSASGPPPRLEGRIAGGMLHLPERAPVAWRGRRSSGPVRLWLDPSVAPVVARDPGEGGHIAAVPCPGGPGAAGSAIRLLLPGAELPG